MSNFTLPENLKTHLDFYTPHCFVYFISDGEYTKIGIAKNMNNRLSSLQVGNPKKLRIVSFVPCDTENSARKIEKHLHKRLGACRVEGEWFKLPAWCFAANKMDFVVDYEDWRLAQYEIGRRSKYKTKH